MPKFKIPINAELGVDGLYLNDLRAWHVRFKQNARKEAQEIALVRLGMSIANSKKTMLEEYHAKATEVKNSVKVGYKATRSKDRIKIVGQITFIV